MSNKDNTPCCSLREIEAQVEAEMCAFGRRRLEEELQKEADLHGQISPPQPAPRAPLAQKDDVSPERRRPR